MNNEFYPTPKTLLDKIFSGVKWSKIQDCSGTVCRKGRYGGIHPGTIPGNQLQGSRH